MAISDYLNDVLKGRDIESDRLATDRARNLDAFRQFQSLFPDASAEDFARFADAASGTSVFQRNSFPTQQTFEKLSFFNQQKRAGDLSQLKLNEVKRQEEEHQVLMNVLDRAAMFATDETDWVTKARAMGGDQLSVSIDKFLADKPTDTMFRASIMKQAEPYVKTAIAAKMSPAAIRSILPNSPALQKAVLAQVGAYYSAYAQQLGISAQDRRQKAFMSVLELGTKLAGPEFMSRTPPDAMNMMVDDFIKGKYESVTKTIGDMQRVGLVEKSVETTMRSRAEALAREGQTDVRYWEKAGPAELATLGVGENQAKAAVGKITQLINSLGGDKKDSGWIVPPAAMTKMVLDFIKDPEGFRSKAMGGVAEMLRSYGVQSKEDFDAQVTRQITSMRSIFRPIPSSEAPDFFKSQIEDIRARANRIRAALSDIGSPPSREDLVRMGQEWNEIIRDYQTIRSRALDLRSSNPTTITDHPSEFAKRRKEIISSVEGVIGDFGSEMESLHQTMKRLSASPTVANPAAPANRADIFAKPPAPPDAPEVRSTLTLKEAPTSEPGRVEIVLPNERIPPLSLDSAQKLGDYFADASKTGLNWKSGQPYQFIERSVVANTKLMLDAYSGKLDPATTAKVEQAAKDFGYTSVEQLYRAYRAKNPGVGLGFADPHGSITRAQASFLNNPDHKPSFDTLPPETKAKVEAIARSLMAEMRAERSENPEAALRLKIKKAAYNADPARSITVWSNYNSATGKGTKNYALSEKLIREAIKAVEEGRGTAR